MAQAYRTRREKSRDSKISRRISVRADACRFDWSRPFLDLLAGELGEVGRAAAVGRYDDQADLVEALAHGRHVEDAAHGRIQLVDDGWRCRFRHVDRVPGGDVEILQALLLGGWDGGEGR